MLVLSVQSGGAKRLAKRKEKHDAKVESRQELPRTCLPVQTKLVHAGNMEDFQKAFDNRKVWLCICNHSNGVG